MWEHVGGGTRFESREHFSWLFQFSFVYEKWFSLFWNIFPFGISYDFIQLNFAIFGTNIFLLIMPWEIFRKNVLWEIVSCVISNVVFLGFAQEETPKTDTAWPFP